MDDMMENKVVAASVADEQGPSRNQFLGIRGKSPSLKNRVIVYDCDQKTVQVKNKNDVVKNIEDYKEMRLPPRQNDVTIFVDPETESQPTTENTAPDGHGNVMLAKLYLDRLGTLNQVLRFLGQLSTLYVTNINPCSDIASGIPESPDAASREE